MTKEPNESIIPSIMTFEGDIVTGRYGLTKREYFASMAMQGILITPGAIKVKDIAEDSVSMADALIEALNKEKK